MTPLRRLHLAGFALVLVGGVTSAGLRMFAAADPVTVDDALAKFRASRPASPTGTTATRSPSAGPAASRTPGARPSGAGATPTTQPGATATTTRPTPSATGIPRPPEGVYVYATTGYETGDAGPAHSRHDYPAETTIVVRHDGCGSSTRWEPVEGRFDDVIDCLASGATRIRTYDTLHTFFGVSERHRYECSGTSWFRPPSVRPGYRWTFSCASDRGAFSRTSARIVGVERVSAGDGMVDALHVRFDTTLTGAAEGTNPSDYWLALHEPYLVRRTGTVDAVVHTGVGDLDYHEEFDIRLTSRTPRT